MISFKLFLENLTIQIDSSDEIERFLKSKLQDNNHADNVIRWYRNEKRSGKSESELKKFYKNGIDNIIDSLAHYDNCVDKIKNAGKANYKFKVVTPRKPVDCTAEQLNLFGNLAPAQDLIKQVIEYAKDLTSFSVGNSKYRIKHDDAKKIYILDFSQNVVCWVTEGPGRETTNKLIYQLWKNVPDINAKMDRGDAFGNAKEFSPYCTNSEEHWNEYENIAFPKKDHIYQQFWYFKKIPNIEYVKGDLTNKKVQEIFLQMSGRGPKDLIAMNDSIGDLRDTNDAGTKYHYLDFGSEIERLEKKNFEVVDDIKIQVINFSNNIDIAEEYTEEKYKTRMFLKGQVPEEYKNQTKEKIDVHNLPQVFKGNIKIENDEGYKEYLKSAAQLKIIDGDFNCVKCESLESFEGTLEEVEGNFVCSYCNSLVSLEGTPKKVKGNFECTYCNSLKSLNGAPKEIGGYFVCTGCELLESLEGAPKQIKKSFLCGECYSLKSLKYAPKEVNNDFYCFFCKNLESIEGAPEKVGKDFDCSYCRKLKSLEGAPKEVGGDFRCQRCSSLTSLEGCPKEISGDFGCQYCDSLISLEEAPKEVGGRFICRDCRSLKYLKGAPEKVGGDFSCSQCNLLKSLKYAPKEVNGNFYCKNCDSLISLEGASEKVGKSFFCQYCHSLKSLEGAPKEVAKDFNCSFCDSLVSLKGASEKVGGNFYCVNCTRLKLLNGKPKHIGGKFYS